MTIYNSITEVIGNTPLLRLENEKTGLKNIDIYLKLEMLNPFGSLKDRTALALLNSDKLTKQHQAIIEASSGNTIKALAVLAKLRNLNTLSVTNRIKIPEVKEIMQLLGVDIKELPGSSPCMDPHNPEDPLYIIKNIIRDRPEVFHTDQYFAKENPKVHYHTTGTEIANDLGKVDYLFATLGTTGSSLGISQKLKEINPNIIITGVATKKGDFIPGIRTENDLYDVGIYKRENYHRLSFTGSREAVTGVLELINKYGVMAGPTSGAVYKVAIDNLKNLDHLSSPRSKAVIIICDRVEWYLSYLKEHLPELFNLPPKANSFADFKNTNLEMAPEIEVENLSTTNDYLLIDIRSNLAYRSGHIPSSINIKEDLLIEMIDDNQLPFPKTKTIIITCVKGNSSKAIVSYLASKGYQALSLKGGLAEYKNRLGILEKSF